jgi:2-dehydropantoate 2-reductase
MRHLDVLEQRFGPAAVLGGQCVISAALDEHGHIVHLNDTARLAFGERDRPRSERTDAVAAAFAGAKFDSRRSEAIVQEMWEKWVFIAALAGITCLMRSSVGDIVAAGGADVATALLQECAAIATASGAGPSAASMQRNLAMLTAPGSALTASMLRDLERGGPTEAEHVLGDLLRRGDSRKDPPALLHAAYLHLALYERRRSATAQPAAAAAQLHTPSPGPVSG